MLAAQATVEEPKPVGVYRPPAYRAPGRRGPTVKSKTPEIDSEIAFPTLSAAMATQKRLVGRQIHQPENYWSGLELKV